MRPELSTKPLKVLWHWFAMGPYHFARMSAVAAQPGIDLTVVETTSHDDHDWHREPASLPFRLITLSKETLGSAVHRSTASAYASTLREVRPDVVVASGYSEPHSRQAALDYAVEYPKTALLLWSETTAFDNRRSLIAETVKKSFVGTFDGALAAGSPHVRYLRKLGMAEPAIQAVGGCVDNAYFEGAAEAARANGATTRPIRSPYFLYVGRFIPVKNLPNMLRAYHLYRVMTSGAAHHLVLVGSGPDEQSLRQLVKDLHLDGVHFAGVQQVADLPAYYAHASAFVMPSWSEPWGLVVNEAMASGIPVLASNLVGSAEDLIIPGKTGYLFDPYKPEELATYFETFSKDPGLTATMGAAARREVDRVSLTRYAAATAAHLRSLHDQYRTRETRALPLRPRLLAAVEQWVR